MRRISALIPVALLLGAGGCAVHLQESTGHPDYDSAVQAISATSLMESVRALSSPGLEGRLPGSPGYREAATLVVERLSSAGLNPGYPQAREGAGGLLGQGWYLHFPMEGNDIELCDLSLPGDHGAAPRLGQDFTCRGYTGSGDVEAEVVFVGYGQSRPDLGYDDYAGLEVEGRIVMAFKQNPTWAPTGGKLLDWGEMQPRVKARTARDHGAKGILLVPVPEGPGTQRPIASLMDGPGEHLSELPQVQISLELGERLLAPSGLGLKERWSEIEQRHLPGAPRPGAATARLRTRAHFEAARDNYNVVGILPGADPVLASEALVISAHLDHVGSQGAADGTRVVWPGANDNASGVSAVLALAEALARGPRPERSVVFVIFSSEEHGLDGSKAYVANPAWPLEKTVALMNFDCIGIGDGLQLGGGEAWPQLWSLARGLDASFGRVVEKSWHGGGADAQAFFEAGIPTLYFATTNAYAHLHLPSDTAETLRPDLFLDTVRLGWLTARTIAGGAYTRESMRPKPE